MILKAFLFSMIVFQVNGTIYGQTTWYKNNLNENDQICIVDEIFCYISNNYQVSSHDFSGKVYRFNFAASSYEQILDKWGGIYEMYFLNKDTGIIGYYTEFGVGYMRTINGGQTWENMNTFTTFYSSLSFIDIDFGFYAFFADINPGSIIYKYHNDTAIIVFTTSDYYLGSSNIYLIDESIVFVTGSDYSSNAIVLRTLDGGSLWEEVFSMPNQQFNDIKFINDSLGFIVGKEGRIFKTTNVGQTWYTINNDSTKTLNAIDFTSNLTGYIVGDSGSVLKSTNLGESWEHIDFINEEDLVYVKCFDEEECHITDAIGDIYSNFYHFRIDENANNEIQIFPNPSQSYINLNLTESYLPFETTLYNLSGQTMIKSENQLWINVSELTRGIFILVIRQGGKVYRQKIVLN